jgi:hypothetical protein
MASRYPTLRITTMSPTLPPTLPLTAFRQGPGILRMREWLSRNADVLDAAVFRQRYPSC